MVAVVQVREPISAEEYVAARRLEVLRLRGISHRESHDDRGDFRLLPRELVREARNIVKVFFANDHRRNGSLVLGHLDDVAKRVREQYPYDPESGAMALMHDLFEDKWKRGWRSQTLHEMGFPEGVIRGVLILTRGDFLCGSDVVNEPYFDYGERIIRGMTFEEVWERVLPPPIVDSTKLMAKITNTKTADSKSNYKSVLDELTRLAGAFENFSGGPDLRKKVGEHYEHEQRKLLRYYIIIHFSSMYQEGNISADMTIPTFIKQNRSWFKEIPGYEWKKYSGNVLKVSKESFQNDLNDLLARESSHIPGGRAAQVMTQYRQRPINDNRQVLSAALTC